MTDVGEPESLQLRPTMNGRRQLGTTRVANEVVEFMKRAEEIFSKIRLSLPGVAPAGVKAS